MSYVNIWIHAVWGTKNHQPVLLKDLKGIILTHIKENCCSKGIYIDEINGSIDHVHCLIRLNADISIAKTMQLIKGESSNWINKNKITCTHFSWADEYYAASVSNSAVPIIRRYIQNQELHHKKRTFQEEHRTFCIEHLTPTQG